MSHDDPGDELREDLAHTTGIHTWCPSSCPDRAAWDVANADLDRRRQALHERLRSLEELYADRFATASVVPDDPRDVLLAQVAAALGVVYRPGDARSAAVLRAVAHGRRVPPCRDPLTRAVHRSGQDAPTRYRVGGTNARNVYLVADGHDFHVATVFDPSDGPYVVDALNAFLERGEG